MQKRIYIETTIPSFYYTLRTDNDSLRKKRLTRQWWAEYANQFTLVSSVAVVVELSQGRSIVAQARLDLLKGLELFEGNSEIDQITQIYIDRLVMPRDPLGDALHLAIASFHEVDALLTWNLAHIANPNKLDFIIQINRELGLPTPELITPLDYLEGRS